jgi:type VI secretion system secreted protein Hcp
MKKLLVALAMVGVLALLLSIPAQAQAAYEFYVTIQGEKQGKFKGESLRKGAEDKIPGVRFQYAVTIPTDPQSGLASGTRRHQPVVITKQWGVSSPQFFHACVTGEHLKSVVIEFVRTNPQGAEYIYQVIRLTDAVIISIRQYANMLNLSDPLTTTRSPELEDITFNFKKIEILNKDANTAATDDWAAPHP